MLSIEQESGVSWSFIDGKYLRLVYLEVVYRWMPWVQ